MLDYCNSVVWQIDSVCSVFSFVVCFSGSQQDVDNLIRDAKDMTQLASWYTLVKSELSKKQSECRALTESLCRTERQLDDAETRIVDQAFRLNVNSARAASLDKVVASQVENCLYISSLCCQNITNKYWEIQNIQSISLYLNHEEKPYI